MPAIGRNPQVSDPFVVTKHQPQTVPRGTGRRVSGELSEWPRPCPALASFDDAGGHSGGLLCEADAQIRPSRRRAACDYGTNRGFPQVIGTRRCCAGPTRVLWQKCRRL